MKTPTIQETMALLSAIVHADEMLSYLQPSAPKHLNPYEKDSAAWRATLNQCRPLLAEYDKMAMLPIRRDGVRYTS